MESVNMSTETSVKIIDDFAKICGVTPLQALTELDHLCFEDWKYTLPGAPTGYQPKTTKLQDDAVTVFCRNRSAWKTEALKQGVDISDFT
jgi:hypothetical protein